MLAAASICLAYFQVFGFLSFVKFELVQKHSTKNIKGRLFPRFQSTKNHS